MALGGHAVAITSLSKHKNEAFELVKLWLSTEAQTKLSASGIAPSSMDPAVQKAFGADIPGFQGKHMEALFMLKPANPGVWSPYELDGVKVVREAYWDMVRGNLDVNTTLRTAEEQLNQAIAEKGPN
jgi:multiple sugar transport system substrate-binding protein